MTNTRRREAQRRGLDPWSVASPWWRWLVGALLATLVLLPVPSARGNELGVWIEPPSLVDPDGERHRPLRRIPVGTLLSEPGVGLVLQHGDELEFIDARGESRWRAPDEVSSPVRALGIGAGRLVVASYVARGSPGAGSAEEVVVLSLDDGSRIGRIAVPTLPGGTEDGGTQVVPLACEVDGKGVVVLWGPVRSMGPSEARRASLMQYADWGGSVEWTLEAPESAMARGERLAHLPSAPQPSTRPLTLTSSLIVVAC